MNHYNLIQNKLTDYGIDAVMITGEANRFYASGFSSSDGIILVTATDAWYFIDNRYLEEAENQVTGAKVVEVGTSYTYTLALNDCLSENNVAVLGFEEAVLSVYDYMLWSNKLSIKLKPCQGLFSALRSQKSLEELDLCIQAQRIAEKSFQEILPFLSTDITERELKCELLYRFMKNGADGPSFDPIVLSGLRSSIPHGLSSDRRLSKGFLTIDFGVKYQGWCSDTTRTLCIGEPTSEMRRVYDTVLFAQKAGITTAKAGVKGKYIDGIARDVIHTAGYAGRFGHGFGHGIGIEVHEAPSLNPNGEQFLREGALVSAEPGIYIPGEFGVRIEDAIYITKNGNINITELTKELIIL